MLPATRRRWHSRFYPSRSCYSIKRPRRDARLSWPRWLVTYRDGIHVRRRSSIQVLTGPLNFVHATSSANNYATPTTMYDWNCRSGGERSANTRPGFGEGSSSVYQRKRRAGHCFTQNWGWRRRQRWWRMVSIFSGLKKWDWSTSLASPCLVN